LICLQLLRWSDQGPQEPATIDVTITSEQHIPGLLAALAVLYHNEDLFKQVSQQDLVSAVVHGDQLAIPRAVELGMQLLKQEAAGGGSTAECCRALAALPTWPTCLLPLVPLMASQCSGWTSARQQQAHQEVLVSALGDLEAVWEDKQLEGLLLALPLPAAELLLSSDHLRVVSEDTVLYTALRYVEHLDSVQGREAAKVALSKCIRCVRLSQRNLLALATTTDCPLFSKQQQGQLLQVLSLCLESAEHCVDAVNSCRSFEVPPAWLQPQRNCLVPAAAKSITWHVNVVDIKTACRAAATTGQNITHLKSSPITAPVSGLAFGLVLQVAACRDTAGACVGVYVDAKCLPRPCINLSFKVTAVNTRHSCSIRRMISKSFGWPNFFGVGPMGGDGWDEAAWAAAGLPLEGHLELQLTVEPL
jgi:hypothetical protein